MSVFREETFAKNDCLTIFGQSMTDISRYEAFRIITNLVTTVRYYAAQSHNRGVAFGCKNEVEQISKAQ